MIQVTISYPDVVALPPSRPMLWRIKHDIELGSLWRPGKPEVFPFFPNHYSPFGAAWQWKTRRMNPLITDTQWSSLYSKGTAFTNENGFNDSEDPRRNYITGEDAGYPDPKVECLNCGGNVITGFVQGLNLVVYVVDYRRQPPATLEPWETVWCVTVDANGIPRRFPQGRQSDGTVVPIQHVFLGDPIQFPVIKIPMSKLQYWDREYLPDPWTRYG